MIRISQVSFDHTRASELWDRQQQEMIERYGDTAIEPPLTDEGLVASFVGDTPHGETVATAVVRWAQDPQLAPGAAEIKRLYVASEHRGHGHSRVMMGAAESAARQAGATSIVLETGTAQPEAIALYESIGYHRIANYGYYKDDPDSVCFARELPTRVMVINGTNGAGRTAVAGAVSTLLTERGTRFGYIDGDCLCQAQPSPADDQDNQSLFFDNLVAVAPHYRARGHGVMVIPCVVERDADRDRYRQAFATASLPAEVTIVRTEGAEQWLDDLGLDDAVVSSAGRSPRETAEDLLASIGW